MPSALELALAAGVPTTDENKDEDTARLEREKRVQELVEKNREARKSYPGE